MSVVENWNGELLVIPKVLALPSLYIGVGVNFIWLTAGWEAVKAREKAVGCQVTLDAGSVGVPVFTKDPM